MGGYGSTRWGWHSKKTQVEECYRLPVSILQPYRNGWHPGKLTWSRGGRETGNISFVLDGTRTPKVVRLVYTIGAKSGNSVDYDYPVELTTSPLAWGGVRYWFTCPAAGCGRRVGGLYLPPGGKYFACRHCYDLSYESRQEGYKDRAFYRHMAGMMQDIIPGATPALIKRILEN